MTEKDFFNNKDDLEIIYTLAEQICRFNISADHNPFSTLAIALDLVCHPNFKDNENSFVKELTEGLIRLPLTRHRQLLQAYVNKCAESYAIQVPRDDELTNNQIYLLNMVSEGAKHALKFIDYRTPLTLVDELAREDGLTELSNPKQILNDEKIKIMVNDLATNPDNDGLALYWLSKVAE